jgi:hypothetical protein
MIYIINVFIYELGNENGFLKHKYTKSRLVAIQRNIGRS